MEKPPKASDFVVGRIKPSISRAKSGGRFRNISSAKLAERKFASHKSVWIEYKLLR